MTGYGGGIRVEPECLVVTSIDDVGELGDEGAGGGLVTFDEDHGVWGGKEVLFVEGELVGEVGGGGGETEDFFEAEVFEAVDVLFGDVGGLDVGEGGVLGEGGGVGRGEGEGEREGEGEEGQQEGEEHGETKHEYMKSISYY